MTTGHDRAVVLRLVVGASADHREDLAGAWVDGEQRRLSATVPFPPREHVVHAREPVMHRIEREPLQVDIERGMNVD